MGTENINEYLEFFKNNYELIGLVLTTAIVAINAFVSMVRGKKLASVIAGVDNKSLKVGRIVNDSLEKAVKNINDFQEIVKQLVQENKNAEQRNEHLSKLLILLLQTANIPISQKQAFLTALNDNSDNSKELAIKALEQSILEEKESIEAENKEKKDTLDKIESL